jgi:hypothetical protein
MADKNPALKYRTIAELPPESREMAQKMAKFLRDLGGVQQLPPSLRAEIAALMEKKDYTEAAKKLAGAGYTSISEAVSSIANTVKGTVDQTGAEKATTDAFLKATDGTMLGYGASSLGVAGFVPQFVTAVYSDAGRIFAGDGMEKVRYSAEEAERIAAGYIGAYHERMKQSKTVLEQPKAFFSGVTSQPGMYLTAGLHYMLQYIAYPLQWAAHAIGWAEKPETPKSFRDLVGQSLLDNAQGVLTSASEEAKKAAAQDVVAAKLTTPAVGAVLANGEGAAVISRTTGQQHIVEKGVESVGADGAISGQTVESTPYKTPAAFVSGTTKAYELGRQGVMMPLGFAKNAGENLQDGRYGSATVNAVAAVGTAKLAQKTAPFLVQKGIVWPTATVAGWFTEQGVTDRQMTTRVEKAQNKYVANAVETAGREAAEKARVAGLDDAVKAEKIAEARIAAHTKALKEAEALPAHRAANPGILRRAYTATDESLTAVRDFHWVRPSARWTVGKASDAARWIITPIAEGARDVKEIVRAGRTAQLATEVKAAAEGLPSSAIQKIVEEGGEAVEASARVATETKPSWFARVLEKGAERFPKATQVILGAAKGGGRVANGTKIGAVIGVPLLGTVFGFNLLSASRAHSKGLISDDLYEEYNTRVSAAAGANTASIFDPTFVGGMAATEYATTQWFADFRRRAMIANPNLTEADLDRLDPTLLGTSGFKDAMYPALADAKEMPAPVRKLLEAKIALEASRETVEAPVLLPEYLGPAMTQTELRDGPKTAELKQKFDALFEATLRDISASDYPQTLAYLDALATGKKPEEALAAAKAAEDAAKAKPVAVKVNSVQVGAVVPQEAPVAPAPKDEAVVAPTDEDIFARILAEEANKRTHSPTILATGNASVTDRFHPAGPRISGNAAAAAITPAS